MPIRYISVPSPVTFIDPLTSKPVTTLDGAQEKPIDFEMIMLRLMQNPMWGESYHNMKAQSGIMNALDKSKTSGVLVLADEDWQRLKQAAEFPKNLGYHPILVYQLLPMFSAIMDAGTTEPKADTVA